VFLFTTACGGNGEDPPQECHRGSTLSSLDRQFEFQKATLAGGKSVWPDDLSTPYIVEDLPRP
jgi:hypothetical protein